MCVRGPCRHLLGVELCDRDRVWFQDCCCTKLQRTRLAVGDGQQIGQAVGGLTAVVSPAS